MRGSVLLVVAAVLLLRLPFLHQAIQGDDIYYLAGAEHAQIDPLHPNHARYPFLGVMVDMRGHPHPPLDAWCLAALIAAAGDVREAPFHAAYTLFSLIAALAALSIARRLSPLPLAATLLFLATPPFVVNGTSLESDLPFLAFWLASIALFMAAVDRRSAPLLALSVLPMALAALAAYQSIVLVPILAIYCWRRARNWMPAWLAAAGAALVLAAWQLFERASTGDLPAAVLAGYMRTYGLQALAQKLKSAVALTGHLGWVIFLPLAFLAFRNRRAYLLAPLAVAAAIFDPNPLFWLSVAGGLLVLQWCVQNYRDFAAQWALIFFAAALVLFFAGSARYLLPLALPVAILASRNVSARWLYAGAACGMALSLALAMVNYRHWDGYRKFAHSLSKQAETGRVWINGEWGLRFYLEREGALPLMRGQAVHDGDIVVTSDLAFPIPVTSSGGILTKTADAVIQPSIPLRLVAIDGRSAYSTTMDGLRPFDVSTAPIDRLEAQTVVERKPTLSYLPMNAPEADAQIVNGIYSLESNQWRWMSSKALLLLKPPAAPAPIEVRFVIPDRSPTRQVVLAADGREVARAVYPGPGSYTLASPPMSGADPVAITISADPSFTVPGDRRELSVILTAAGFTPR